jgi:hypothetical protein
VVGAEFDVPAAFAAGRPIPLRFAWPAGCRVAVKQRTTSSIAGASGASFVLTTAAVPGTKNLLVRFEEYTPTGELFSLLDPAGLARVAKSYGSFALTIDATGKQVGTTGVLAAVSGYMNELAKADERVNNRTTPPAAIAATSRSIADTLVRTMWDGLAGSIVGLGEVPTTGSAKVKVLTIDNAMLTARAQGPRLVALRIEGTMSKAMLKEGMAGAAGPEIDKILRDVTITSRAEIVVDPATLRSGSIFEKSSGKFGSQPFAYERTTTFDWRNSTGCV